MQANTFLSRYVFPLVLAFMLTACELPNDPVSQSAATLTGDFSTGETLQVLVNLNTGGMQQAQLVDRKSDDEGVKDLARTIIEDHKNLNRRIDSLAASGIKLEKSPLSRGLKVQAEQIRDNLADLYGTEFDCTYLEKQVEQHELALDILRSDIQPSTEDQQIQQLLSGVEPALEKHLRRARQLYNEMPACPREV